MSVIQTRRMRMKCLCPRWMCQTCDKKHWIFFRDKEGNVVGDAWLTKAESSKLMRVRR